MPGLRWRRLTEWRFVLVAALVFLWSSLFLTRRPGPDLGGDEAGWEGCEGEERRIANYLVVMRTSVGARGVRDVIRGRVGEREREQGRSCNMDVVFLFGGLGENSSAVAALARETAETGDIVRLDTVPDAHSRDAPLALHFARTLNQNKRRCRLYRQVIFGQHMHNEERLLAKPSTPAERSKANFWELDGCLRFSNIRDNNPLFYAHYFPRRLHLQLETQLSFSYNEDVITPHDYPYLLGDPQRICNRSDTGEYFAVVAVHSSQRSFDNRILIRDTWGHRKILQKYGMKLIFFVARNSSAPPSEARKLREESDSFGDIVQEDFEEAYKNMTLKQVGLFKYMTLHCSHLRYRFLLKVDDDVVFDLPNSIRLLTGMTRTFPNGVPHRSVFCYHLNEIADVPRYKGKWFVAPGEFPGKFYPAYCSGAGYFLTRDLVGALYRAALHVRTFWVDDTYITGVLPNVIGDVMLYQLPKQFSGLTVQDLERADPVDAYPAMYFFHTGQSAWLFKKMWNIVRKRHVF
ncbi:uncharacterized protein LOC129598175 [Paramacrobiotus metropolitanus]|uniref:uncharacterized protein LOC129598175 n=1 Tax=Paramacrobiotus metropolitanus TaxID=2943436 RepID=UPI00244591D7|nr:uncharacterized protein LOC129598175 [Paramacrobiotus metropolitanus]